MMSTNYPERREVEERAERLKWARQRAGFTGPRPVAKALGINEGTYKQHERGRNGFGIADARRYARLFGVSLAWLNFNTGSPDDSEPATNTDRLREIFARAAEAPAPVQDRIIDFVEYELSRHERSLETATSPVA